MIKLNLYLLHQIEHIFQIHLQFPFILGILICPFPPRKKYLGVTLSSNLSMEKHVTNVCRSAYVEIRRISNIRHYLTTDATKTLVCAFILSKLDYCNSLLSSCPNQLLNKLQNIQNSAARLVFKARKQEHIKPPLRKLHWQPVHSRIQYKNSTLCYNSFSETYPPYLSEHLTVYYPSRQLRSVLDTKTFRIPLTKTKTFGERAFSFTGPKQWNSLPYDVRYSPSVLSCKKALTTYLFKSAFE